MRAGLTEEQRRRLGLDRPGAVMIFVTLKFLYFIFKNISCKCLCNLLVTCVFLRQWPACRETASLTWPDVGCSVTRGVTPGWARPARARNAASQVIREKRPPEEVEGPSWGAGSQGSRRWWRSADGTTNGRQTGSRKRRSLTWWVSHPVVQDILGDWSGKWVKTT